MLQSLLPAGLEAALAAAAGWLVTWTVHSTVALGGAWLLDGRTRFTRSARARSTLWTGAVAACLVSATLQTATGLGPGVDLAASEAEKVVAEFPVPGAAGDGPEPAARGAAPGPPSLQRPHDAARLDPTAWYRTLGHDWPYLLGLAWLGGALVLLVRSAGDLRALRAVLGGRTPAPDGPARRALDELTAAAGMDRPVRLGHCPRLSGPAALPGREIVVPERVAGDLDADELRAVLAHELAHVARGDATALLLIEGVRRLLFFQPLVHLAAGRAGEAAEACSDEWVRRLGLGPSLAGGLLTVARRMRRERGRLLVAGLSRGKGLGDRVRRLLEPAEASDRSRAPDRPATPAAGLAAAALLLAVPAAHVATPAHVSTAPEPPGEGRLAAEAAAGAGAEALDLIAAHAGTAPAAPTPSHRGLAGRPGGTLLVHLERPEGSVSVALRPGGETLRLVGPSGRERRLTPPAAGREAWTASLRVPGARPGRYELHVPASVRRLALRVGGRTVASGERLRGGELPRLISLR